MISGFLKMFHKLPKAFLLLFILMAGIICKVSAQDVTITAKTDTNAILIGSQFRLNIEASQPTNAKVEWPVIADTFNLFLIVKALPVDTLSKNENRLIRHQQFIITSFDSGFHIIPPIVLRYKIAGSSVMDSAITLPILITVNTVPVDTTKAIKDLKAQVTVPWTLMDFLPFIIGALIIILVSFLIYKYLKKRQAKIKIPEIKTPSRPAHEIALEALKNLEEKKLWQQGNFKGYFTQLSDITRAFIENKWNLPAMEMTTDEIVQLQVIKEQQRESYDKLNRLLTYSDLVKFAKVIPVAHECEQNLQQAYSFVNANLPDVERRAEL